MKTKFYFLIIFTFIILSQGSVYAQGCVAVRAMGGTNPLSSDGYWLKKGELTVGISYRYFHSWRHFVGKDEKAFRQTTQGGFGADGKERGNAVNIYSHSIDLNLSYALTNRIQFNLSIPYVHNERSQVLKIRTGDKVIIDERAVDQVLVGKRYSVYAKGLGDIRFSTNYWLFDQAQSENGNLMLGVGVKLNTGSHTEKDDAIKLDAEGNVVKDEQVMMDQAIQPGDGGVGISLEVQGFRKLVGGVFGFASGYYLFNPKESNGSFKSAPKAGLEGYNVYACPDQYLARVGVMTAVLKSKALTLSLAGRWEGIPAYDAFGGQVAYRRPGYVVAVESGVSYRHNKHTLALFIPYNFVRNRIQSAADIADQNLQNVSIAEPADKVHVQGDAAFADYSINVNYTYRIGKLF
jgi:hypothetical protein